MTPETIKTVHLPNDEMKDVLGIDETAAHIIQHLDYRGVQIAVKRLDQLHPLISGNKWYKLKYNLLAAQAQGARYMLSFGGAYSNHIAALAVAARVAGLSSIGIIRGDELAQQPRNVTLSGAEAHGMQLEFVSRQDYRRRHEVDWLEQWQHRYPDAYLIPEGGNNALGVRGCEDILSSEDRSAADVICCAVGTGATLAGLIRTARPDQQVWGMAAIGGDLCQPVTGLQAQVQQWLSSDQAYASWQIWPEDQFGGYGRQSPQLQTFMAQVLEHYRLPLDPVYTAKAFYRLFKMIDHGVITPQQHVLFIHTGASAGFPAL